MYFVYFGEISCCKNTYNKNITFFAIFNEWRKLLLGFTHPRFTYEQVKIQHFDTS